MNTYRKLPIEVEAHQWFRNGDHPEDGNSDNEGAIVGYFRHPNILGSRPCQHCEKPMNDHGWIDTLERGHAVCPGDWIIRGIAGELYPCKPDIFERTYELVN